MSDVSASAQGLLRGWIHWIMGGLVAWGLLLGLGAYLYTPDPSVARSAEAEKEAIIRGIIVAICAVVFVIFWWVMLALRQRRLSHLAARTDLK